MANVFRVVDLSTDHVHRALLIGELDRAHRDDVIRCLTNVADQCTLADLSCLTFIDAGGLGALVTAKKAIERRGGCLEIRGAQGFVRRVFKIARLESLLDD